MYVMYFIISFGTRVHSNALSVNTTKAGKSPNQSVSIKNAARSRRVTEILYKKKKHKETAKNKAQQDTMNWQRQREANRIHKEGMKTKDRKCEVTQDTQGKKNFKNRKLAKLEQQTTCKVTNMN